MNVACIIQARLGSSRLPRKVLADIGCRTMLAHVIERARAIPGVNSVAVATTTAPDDVAVAAAAAAVGAPVFRGHATDVLDRYYQAAKSFRADAAVRVTADCPFLDPEVSGLVVRRFLDGDLDYCSNILPATYPDGLDTEILSFAALDRVWRAAKLGSDREHVTTYIRTRPKEFNVANVESPLGDLSNLRWTVDEADDLDFVRGVVKHLRPSTGTIPGMKDVLQVLRDHPEVAALNKSHQRNEGWAKSIEQDRQEGVEH
jgi:spore coat polysaccharide biosynthesis protein SpsF (cytidylyltransferase family)